MHRVQLKHPVRVDGKTITAVTIRRPKREELIAARPRLEAIRRYKGDTLPNSNEIRAIVAFVSIISDLPEKTVSEFDLDNISSIVMSALMEFGNWAERGAPGVTRSH